MNVCVILRLIRQSYLEIALIYMYSSGIASMKEGSSIDIYSGAESGSEDTSSETSKSRMSKVCKLSPLQKNTYI